MVPKWTRVLGHEDWGFIKNFIVSSGSIKEMSALYGVSYPTMRTRLNRLIQKIELADDERIDAYELLIKRMAVDEQIDIATARTLIDAYRETRRKGENHGEAGDC